MDKGRKHSDDIYDSEEEGTELFPRSAAADLKVALQTLAEHYNPAQHNSQLVNCCFRCHHAPISRAYNQFRLKVQPTLQEPRISTLYQNDQFVDLQMVSRNKEDQTLTIPPPLIEPIPKDLAQQLDELFQRFGYVPHLERFLLFYPSYLQKHRSVEADLFESGKIQPKSAYFVALCASAQMGSVYMMARYLKLYLKSGGQTSWYHKQPPLKLSMLLKLNRLMARCPWQITSQVIENILQNEQVHWNTNELARYVQIMAFAHQNSTIALSVGLLPEEDHLLSQLHMKKILDLKIEYDSRIYESTQTQKLAVMIPYLKDCDSQSQQVDRTAQFKIEVIESKNTVVKKSMKKVQQAVEQYMKQIGNQLTKQQLYKQINKCVQPLLPQFQAIEKRGSGGSENNNITFDYSEYNYKFMAYPILNSLTHDTADKIENLIAYSEVMTRGNFGSVNISNSRTKEFRKAVRYYAENLCGYTHLEYDFKNNISGSLPMALKYYIRLVMMSPLHISRQVLRSTNHESGRIQCFDLGHLAVLVANTKMSLSLMLSVQAFEL